MKKNIFTIVVLIFTIIESNAQINTPAGLSTTIAGKHAFLDASDFGINWASNESKGMVFPQTDLTQWVFQTEVLDGIIFSTAYDGMVVYNTGTGSTLATAPFGGLEILQKANNGVVTSVSPGFYYFYNPLVALTSSTEIVENGKWLPLGTGGSGTTTTPVKNIVELTPIDTGVAIEGKTIWAVKGSFSIPFAPTALVPNPTYVSTAVVSISKPTDFTGYLKMTTYQNGKTFRSDISTLNVDTLDATKLIVVTGNGLFSEVYPGGDYTYTLEFFKI